MKNDISIAEIHALYVEKALMGTPDYLRDECAAALGAEATRQAEVMGLHAVGMTMLAFGVLQRIRYQEQVAQARAELDAAIGALADKPALCHPATADAVNRVLVAAATLNSTVQAAADRTSETRAHYQCMYHCKASACSASRDLPTDC